MLVHIPSRHARLSFSIGLILIVSILFSQPLPADASLNEPAPTDLTTSSPDFPLPFSPLLAWSRNIQAVAYEIEFFNHEPTGLPHNELSDESIFHTTEVYKNYYNPPLASFAAASLGKEPLFWRVRALGMGTVPISAFSEVTPLFTSPERASMDAPVPETAPADAYGSLMLYPVYSWVAPTGAASFEVDIFSEDPEQNHAAQPLATLHAAFSELYDPSPRYGNHPFYWRVRALDDKGQQLGHWSAVSHFTTAPAEAPPIAIFGDSISHGGGHISYGPEDLEFSWPHYLDFPTINLSQSGDTSQMMVQRFEADVLPFHPKYLLIMGGSNSLRGGVPAEDVIHDLETIRQKCLSNGIKPILLTLPPIHPENIQRAFAEPTADDWQSSFASVNKYIQTQVHVDTGSAIPAPEGVLPTEYGLDGLHPDPSGKALMGQAVNAAWAEVSQEADQE